MHEADGAYAIWSTSALNSQKTKPDFVVQFFQAFTGFVILAAFWSPVVVEL